MPNREAIFLRLLGTLTPGRLLDLGCGHGKFSLIANDLGWSVTAVDARTERMPRSEGIEWVEADVRSFLFDATEFSCICVLGLLYHLELQDQIDLLARCSGVPTIVDTHVALRREMTDRGYDGRLFREIESDDPAELAATATASVGNLYSFWPTEDSLVRMFHDSGFKTIWKLTPSYRPDRTFYLCN